MDQLTHLTQVDSFVEKNPVLQYSNLSASVSVFKPSGNVVFFIFESIYVVVLAKAGRGYKRITTFVCHSLFILLTDFACQDKLLCTNLLIIYGFINHLPSNIGLSLALIGCAAESRDLNL